MRLWSLHPQYLDSKGLVAVWREGLLARAVLLGNTRGYRNHPQLLRFRQSENPLESLDAFLQTVVHEAVSRGYHFDATKIGPGNTTERIRVTRGQVLYERGHLNAKLEQRDPGRVSKLVSGDVPILNPVFTLVEGEVEAWEKV